MNNEFPVFINRKRYAVFPALNAPDKQNALRELPSKVFALAATGPIVQEGGLYKEKFKGLTGKAEGIDLRIFNRLSMIHYRAKDVQFLRSPASSKSQRENLGGCPFRKSF